MKIEIKHKLDERVLFSCEAENISSAVELAVSSYASLRYADLRYADLSNADLSYADLSNADLRYADLRSANLRNADLSYTNLCSANLRNADLRTADLRYADLSNADLSYASLRNADLSYADLSNADLRSANFMTFQYQQHPAYYTFDGTLRVGCMCLPITEWKETFEDIGLNNSYSEDQIKMYGQFIDMCYEHFISKES